jgi:hypothetical protein
MADMLTEIEYLRRRVELLQRLRDCALSINDGMERSKPGDCFTYEGGMNAVECFRDLEAQIVSFDYHHKPPREPRWRAA